MEWRDEGLVIGLRRYGESSAIVEAMTRQHGRHLGLVRSARSPRLQSVLQAGNTLGLVWRARLDEQLGHFAVEPLTLRAGRLIDSAMALAGLSYLGALVRMLAERDAHEDVFAALTLIVDHLDAPDIAPLLLARFELRMLSECGFRLDLDACAATGARKELIYVSPKSGRAVSAVAGAPYRERLLPLPAFLREPSAAPDAGDLEDAFRLTRFFLERDLFGARGLEIPDARRAFLAAALRRM